MVTSVVVANGVARVRVYVGAVGNISRLCGAFLVVAVLVAGVVVEVIYLSYKSAALGVTLAVTVVIEDVLDRARVSALVVTVGIAGVVKYVGCNS